MEQLQCKICGQALVEVREGFYKCSGCLSEFKKEATVTDEQKRLQEAYEMIRKGNFSDAEGLCTTLLKTNSSSYEAYWVRALAKNGVIFVRDIGDRMVPTCQNIVEEQFLSDGDVQKAIELAPYEIAENYRTQGARIEAIRKEWFEMASKEAPYDVFICFKDSDKEHGIDRTGDSVFAQDMYNYLCTKGLNVFFSRVSLMGKVSEHYEPYIYNALKTAKVMIVYGEKAEYFNSTWLRNEWSRFIARMQRENMPKDSLIVAYRGVDPYRIPSALLGGRQGLDLTPPSAFNILVEKVVSTVAKAKKVITLERKEIQGGQMSKKASTIVQAEIQKRTIGANTPVKLDFSLESKLRMVKNYLAQEMWQDAADALEPVLEQAPHNGEALVCKLLIRTRHKTLDDLKAVDHFEEVALLQSILDAADQETAQELLDLFYSLHKLPDDEYDKILRTILLYEYDHRDRNIQKAFEIALASINIQRFNLLLQTLDSVEVDRYIDLNSQMLTKLLEKQRYQDARKFIHNILTVNEGNLDILRVDCEISWITEDGRFIQKFETLLKYADDPNQYVQYFLDKILEDKQVTSQEVELLKKLLSYYKGEFIPIHDTLLLITSLLIKDGMFEQATYFDNLILAEDSQRAEAWLYLCFIGTQSASIADMINSDVPMNQCRGFDEYCSLVGDAKQKEIFAALKKQQGIIEQKNLNQYKTAAGFQKKGRIADLEKAIAIYESIAGFKDSAEQALACQRRIVELQSAAAERHLAAERAKKKAAKIFKITLASVIAAALVVTLLVTFIIPLIRYSYANSLINKGEYSKAGQIYTDLGGFFESEQRIAVVDGINQINQADFDNGIKTILAAGVPIELTYTMGGGDFSGDEHISLPGMTILSVSDKVNVVPLTETNGAPESVQDSFAALSDYSGLRTPGRNGYRFVEWKLETFNYQTKGTFELKLTAVWSTKDYTVSYDLAGGELSGANVSEYDPEDDAFTLINPTRKGYTFTGWTGTDLSEPTLDVTVPTGSYGDRAYTATWKANEYTITYDVAGGTVSSESQLASFDSNVEHPIPERTGYTFLGWFDGETKYEDGVWTLTNDLALTANWEIITYTITYDKGNVLMNAGNPTTYTVETETFTMNNPDGFGTYYTFLGWTWEGQSEPVMEVTIPKGTTGNKNFKWNWVKTPYTISLNPNGGNVSKTQITVVWGDYVYLPIPTWKDGSYKFVGWYSQKGIKYENSFEWGGTSDLVLVAKWEATKYTISYSLKGGTNADTNPATYTVNDRVSLAEPTRNGYTFTGWTYEGQSTPTKDVVIAVGTIGNKNYTANWTANEYTLTFDAAGGNVSQSQITATYDQGYTLPTPEWAGHTFAGWYSGTQKVTSGTWNRTSDLALVAKWDAIAYDITYTLNGGKNASKNPATYTLYDQITLADPARTGYTFIGWTYEGQAEPIKGVTIALGTMGDKAYTANWQANTYTITFDANGGNVDLTTQDVVYDTEYAVPTPVKPGYIFNGWYHGDTVYAGGTWKTAADITLTAKWKIINYSISYELNGGTNASSNPSAYTVNDEIALAEPTRTGYTFTGWTGEGQVTPIKDVIVAIGTTGDRVYTANWKANEYTITFDANGGEVENASQIVTYDAAFTLPTPTRPGYTFNGWLYDGSQYSDGTWLRLNDITIVARWIARSDIAYVVNHYQQNANDDGYTLESSLNLTGTADASVTPEVKSFTHYVLPAAQTVTISPDGSLVVNYYYDRVTYNLTYVTNGGDTLETQTFKYEQTLVISTPTRAGYTFGGWFTNKSLSTAYSATATLNADTTIYAYWIEENKPTDFMYSGASEVVVSAYHGESTTMWIPAYIGGVPVTTIPASAFKDQATLLKVVVPDTVTSIGLGAFQGCSSLKDITLPFVGNTANAANYNAVFGYIFGYDSYYRSGSAGGLPSTDYKSYSSTEYVNITRFDISDATWQYSCHNTHGVRGLEYHQGSYGGAAYWTKLYGYLLTSYYYYIPTTIENVTITKQTVIPVAAFNGCDFIKTITLPSTSDNFGSYAFQNCSATICYAD